MAVAAPPPRSPESTDSIDRAELEALIEALIEEARRRARRRRRRYGACVLAVLLAAGCVYFGFTRTGGSADTSLVDGDHDLAGAPARSNGRWQPARGPYGGPVSALAVAPGAMYAGTNRGVFRSKTGGRGWTRVGLTGWRIASLAVDPRTPGTVYAGADRRVDEGGTFRQALFRSVDGGRTWRALGPKARWVSVAPTNPPTVYAAVGAKTAHENALLRSTDGGRSWRAADRGLPRKLGWTLAFDPLTPITVYAASDRRIFRSSDRGEHWTEASAPVSPRGVLPVVDAGTALALDPRRPATIYLGTNGGVLKSFDRGRHWVVANRAMVGRRQVVSLAVAPDSGTVFAATYCNGVFTSVDGGRTWRPASAGLEPECGMRGTTIAFDARFPRTVYLFRPAAGVFKSSDGGVHWAPANTGLSLTSVSALAVDPQRPQTVYASAGERGLFASTNGGRSWRQVPAGLDTVNAVALDPADGRVLLAAGAGRHLVRSTDAGRTWLPASAGIRGRRATAIAIRGETAYAGTTGFGVFASTDAGRTWHRAGPRGVTYVHALATAPADPTIVYVGSMGSNARGLYRSADGGGSWERLADRDVMAIALDPTTPMTVYIGSDGIYKSTDGGTTWEPANVGLPRIATTARDAAGNATRVVVVPNVTALVVDPKDPRILYAATAERGVFRSTDAGLSWRPFSTGLMVRRIESLGLDPTGRTLYAGTDGGGVATLERTAG